MSLAVWMEGGDIPDNPSTQYEHHPITQWAKESLANWLDALAMMEACNQEWIYRYGHDRDRVHGSLETLRDIKQEAIRVLPRTGYTLQPCVFPDKFAVHPEPTTVHEICVNYRNYVKETKAGLDWFVYEKNRPKPEFLRSARA